MRREEKRREEEKKREERREEGNRKKQMEREEEKRREEKKKRRKDKKIRGEKKQKRMEETSNSSSSALLNCALRFAPEVFYLDCDLPSLIDVFFLWFGASFLLSSKDAGVTPHAGVTNRNSVFHLPPGFICRLVKNASLVLRSR